MWVRKNFKEIIYTLLPGYIKYILIYFIGFVVVSSIIKYLRGPSRTGQLQFKTYYDVLFFSLFLSIFSTSIQKIPFLKIFDGSQNLICNKCNKVKPYEFNKKCECGGKYIYIELMKYIEDNDSIKKRKFF